MQKIHCVIIKISSQQQFVITRFWMVIFVNKPCEVQERVWEHHLSLDGRMLHARWGKQTLYWFRVMGGECWRSRESVSLCLCVGPGMKGYRWACTDRHMGRPVASGNEKPWFTTRRWSDAHSSVWELDKHCWSAHACACANTHTLTAQKHK